MKTSIKTIFLLILFFSFIPYGSPKDKHQPLADMMPEHMRAAWSGPLKTTMTLYLKTPYPYAEWRDAYLSTEPDQCRGEPSFKGTAKEIPVGTKVYIDNYVETFSTGGDFFTSTSDQRKFVSGHFEDGTKFTYTIKYSGYSSYWLTSDSSSTSRQQGFLYVFVPVSWFDDYMNAPSKMKEAIQNGKVTKDMTLKEVIMSMGPPSKITLLDEFGVYQYTFRSIYYYFDKDDKPVSRPNGLKEYKRPKQP